MQAHNGKHTPIKPKPNGKFLTIRIREYDNGLATIKPSGNMSVAASAQYLEIILKDLLKAMEKDVKDLEQRNEVENIEQQP